MATNGMENWNPHRKRRELESRGRRDSGGQEHGQGQQRPGLEEILQGLRALRGILGKRRHEQRRLHPRHDPDERQHSTGAYEIQIWDKNPNPAYSTGSLVNVASVNPVYKAGGRWNTYEIYAKGPEITVKLNGVVTVSAYDKKFPEGRIGIHITAGRSRSASCW